MVASTEDTLSGFFSSLSRRNASTSRRFASAAKTCGSSAAAADADAGDAAEDGVWRAPAEDGVGIRGDRDESGTFGVSAFGVTVPARRALASATAPARKARSSRLPAEVAGDVPAAVSPRTAPCASSTVDEKRVAEASGRGSSSTTTSTLSRVASRASSANLPSSSPRESSRGESSRGDSSRAARRSLYAVRIAGGESGEPSALAAASAGAGVSSSAPRAPSGGKSSHPSDAAMVLIRGGASGSGSFRFCLSRSAEASAFAFMRASAASRSASTARSVSASALLSSASARDADVSARASRTIAASVAFCARAASSSEAKKRSLAVSVSAAFFATSIVFFSSARRARAAPSARRRHRANANARTRRRTAWNRTDAVSLCFSNAAARRQTRRHAENAPRAMRSHRAERSFRMSARRYAPRYTTSRQCLNMAFTLRLRWNRASASAASRACIMARARFLSAAKARAARLRRTRRAKCDTRPTTAASTAFALRTVRIHARHAVRFDRLWNPETRRATRRLKVTACDTRSRHVSKTYATRLASRRDAKRRTKRRALLEPAATSRQTKKKPRRVVRTHRSAARVDVARRSFSATAVACHASSVCEQTRAETRDDRRSRRRF